MEVLYSVTAKMIITWSPIHIPSHVSDVQANADINLPDFRNYYAKP